MLGNHSISDRSPVLSTWPYPPYGAREIVTPEGIAALASAGRELWDRAQTSAGTSIAKASPPSRSI
jgi:hypothetical protein